MNLRKFGQMVGLTTPRQENDQSQIQVNKPEKKVNEPLKVLLQWEAPSRVQLGSINNKFSRPFLIIGVVLILLLAIMREFVIILFVASVVFFLEVLSKSKPENAKYQISNKGVKYDEMLYTWNEINSYYFFEKGEMPFLGLNTNLGLPSRIYVSIAGQDKTEIKKILDEYILYLEEEPKSFLDTTYDKIIDKFDI